MNTPALPAALLGSPVNTPLSAGPAPAAGNAGGSDAFAGLLQGESAVAGSLQAEAGNDVLPAQATQVARELDETGPDIDSEDAPWPPAGLETLIAVPSGSVPEAMPPRLAGMAGSGLSGGSSLAMPATPAGQVATAPVLASALGAGPSATPVPSAPAALDLAIPATEAGELPPLQDLAQEMGAAGGKLELALVAGGEEASPSAFSPLLQFNASVSSQPLAGSSFSSPEVPGTLELHGSQMEAEIGESIEWMVDQKLQSARIRISPEHLGTIEVELKLDGDRVHAHFSAAQAEVRQVLNDSLPKLREMLDAQGLQMGDTAVQSQASGQGQQESAPAQGRDSATGKANGSGSDEDTPVRILHRGLLDTYA